MAAKDIDLIVWPNQALSDLTVWQHNLQVVRWFCKLGKVIKWQTGTEGKDTYVNFPLRYDIDGVRVEFLPHWGFWNVGDLKPNVPRTEDEIRAIIRQQEDA